MKGAILSALAVWVLPMGLAAQDSRERVYNYEVLNYCGMTDLFDATRELFCLPLSGSG